ncbi:type II toxin-antitoxin system VapC family toxin [soil metagenome]
MLDTHALLWWLADDPRLGEVARAAIASPDTTPHFSAASIWEAGIKSALGRLDLQGVDLVTAAAEGGFVGLDVTAHHAWNAAWLPRHHHDPFDRMLVAQAASEDLTLVTADQKLDLYGIKVLPC